MNVLISCNRRTRYMCNKTYLLSELLLFLFFSVISTLKKYISIYDYKKIYYEHV